MKCARFLVSLMAISTLTCLNAVPLGSTTTRYTSGGQNIHFTQLPQFSNSNELLSLDRISKQPKNESFYNEVLSKIVPRSIQQISHSQVKANDPKTINLTLKAPKKIRSKVVPPQILIDVTNSVNVTKTKNQFKVTTVTKAPVIRKSTVNVVSSSTKGPFRIKLTPKPTIIKTSNPVHTAPTRKPLKRVPTTKSPPRIKTTIRPSTTKRPKKTTVKRIVTKWTDHPTLEEIKQNWYEEGVPYPNPNPEINSHSPAFSISHSSPSPSETPTDDIPNDLSNAISTFNLDMEPNRQANSPCPTVHITSSVLNPQKRQDCSDLNLVINSHIHQNPIGADRSPLVPEASEPVPDTYDTLPVDEALEDPVDDPLPPIEEDGAAEAAAPAAASPGGGGTGGPGGSGGTGANGGDNEGLLRIPNIKGLFDILGYVFRILGAVLRFLMNPWLYIIPITLFFKLGFLAVLGLFPWWVPALFLFVDTKGTKKSNLSYYKHVHKTIHHPNGWFWNHQTKSWQNILDLKNHRRADEINRQHNQITKAIDRFTKEYETSSTQSWKWRRKDR